MIYWYENLSDVAEAEINEHILNEGVLYLNSNVPENFLFLCEKIHETLDLQDRIDKEELEDFNIYEHQKLDIVLEKIHNLPRKNLIKFFERLVSEGRVFRIPGTSSYYCSSYSINRMGQLAGFHLKYLINQKNEFSDESIWFKSKTYEKFISIVKINTIGFLASKIINPYRKCDLYLDVVKQLAKLDKKFVQKRNSLELFKSVVEIEDREKLSDILQPYSLFTCHESARKLGFYLGEILYEHYLVKNRNDELLKFLNYFFEMERSEENFQSILRELLPSNQYILHQKRYF